MKVVIVDLKGKYAAALTEEGEVRRIVNNSYEIGQEIELYDIQEVRQPRIVPRVIRRVAAVAAAIIILMIGTIGTAYAIPYGTVSLESDPSIEYTINCFDYVIGVKALNEDGETVLSEIGDGKLKHHKIDDAVKTTVEQIKKDGYLDEEDKGISINASTGNDQHSEHLQQDLDDRVHQDMGIPQQSPNQPAEKNNPENNNAPAEDQQQKQDQEQAPNQDQNQNQNQPENGYVQNGTGQNDSPQNQDGGSAPDGMTGSQQRNNEPAQNNIQFGYAENR